VLEIANKAYDLFKCSEMEEKRQLMRLVLSNTRIEGRKVLFEAQKPFNMILDFADRQAWLEKWYEFGKIDWVSELEYPEWTVKEVGRFLQH